MKFCSECGNKLADEALFCGECGTRQEPPASQPQVTDPQVTPVAPPQPVPVAPPVTPPPQVAAVEAPPVIPPQPAAVTPPVYTPPVEAPVAPAPAPKEKKPMPKGMKIALAVVAVVAVGLFATTKILGAMNSPETISEKFITALENRDFASLSALTTVEDDLVTLDETNVQPLFDLYEESEYFRNSIADRLANDAQQVAEGTDITEDSFGLYPVAGFGYTGYMVQLPVWENTTRSTNLPGADIYLEGSTKLSTREDSETWGYITMENLLPGQYQVTGSYETLSAETELNLYLPADPDASSATESETVTSDSWLHFDYINLYVYSDNQYPITLIVDGQENQVVESYQEVYLPFLTQDTTVEAQMDMGRDEPLTISWNQEEEVFYPYFQLATVDVNLNTSYSFDIDVICNGDYAGTISAGKTYWYNTNLLVGDVIEFVPQDELFASVTVEVDDYYVYESLSFGLADMESVIAFGLEHIASWFTAYNNWDMDYLELMVATGSPSETVDTLHRSLDAGEHVSWNLDSLGLTESWIEQTENGFCAYLTYAIDYAQEDDPESITTYQRVDALYIHLEEGQWVMTSTL